jgi:hypothetical protein
MKGVPQKEIAKKYNVSYQLISNILLKKVWKHVKEV